MAQPRGRGRKGHVSPMACRGAPKSREITFSVKKKQKKSFHIYKIQFPKSEEKIEIGGNEKLGAPDGVSPHCKCLAAPLHIYAVGSKKRSEI